MGLVFAQRFALGIENRGGVGEMTQIAEPAFGVGRRGSHHRQQSLRKGADQPGNQHGWARPGQAPQAQCAPRAGSSRDPVPQGSGQRPEQRLEAHARRLRRWQSRPPPVPPAMPSTAVGRADRLGPPTEKAVSPALPRGMIRAPRQSRRVWASVARSSRDSRGSGLTLSAPMVSRPERRK